MINESLQEQITINDFKDICRVCLQTGDNMVDIFSSEMENQLMEVTNLKVKPYDELPKTLCQKCNNQVNEFSKFQKLAKSSEFYLKSLLSISINSSDSNCNHQQSDGQVVKMKRLKKWNTKLKQKKLKTGLESDNVYLIFVPELRKNNSGNSKICIRVLNSDNDNLYLTNYCKSLINNHLSDHTYPKEQKEYNSCNPKREQEKIYTLNLHVYECSECKASFEDFDSLTIHFLTHEKKPLFKKHKYICPVCQTSLMERDSFLMHLKSHRSNGFLFTKGNESYNIKENEKDTFSYLFSNNIKKNQIFNVNLDSVKCNICFENLQVKKNISDHFKACHSNNKPKNINFSINYYCPICCLNVIDKEKVFIEHLMSHKDSNNYFIKVDGNKKPIPLEDNDNLFVSYKEAEKILTKNNTVYKIININSCDKCEFSSDSFTETYQHYKNAHYENISKDISLVCPVCSTEYQSENVDKTLIEFYNHLRFHICDGVCYILVNRNGKIANTEEKYSDIFTQSVVLYSVGNNFMVHNISPQLVLLDEENSFLKYTCDLCQENFNKKQEIVTHLKIHQKSFIQDRENYFCDKCGKIFPGKLSYKKHYKKHSKSSFATGKKPVCVICNKIFARKGTLNGHLKHHFKENKGNECFESLLDIICEKCGKSFSNKASLTKHNKIHSKEKENTALQCEICGKDFFRQSSFEKHRSAHLNPKYFECGICKLPVASMTNLQKHIQNHKNGSNTFDCSACKLSFLTKDSLTAHQAHTGHYLDREPLECNVCHEKFFIGKKFTEHIKSHPKYKMGECTLCGKRLSTIQSLMLHMGRHFEANSILCPHCGKQFFEEKNYNRHLLTHEGIKSFQCDTEGCKKSFYTLFELNRHMKYHNNTRDFRCPYCSKSFHEANHLTVHVRTHTGERPYICPHCNKGFVTRTHCKYHIKLVHQGIGYELIKSNISKKVTVFEALETS